MKEVVVLRKYEFEDVWEKLCERRGRIYHHIYWILDKNIK